jgi:hypothetical protein
MVSCSVCGRSIKRLEGGLFAASRPPALDQWLANVCVNCRRVYCSECIELGGPTPCPTCGEPTEPAQRMYLEGIGLSR